MNEDQSAPSSSQTYARLLTYLRRHLGWFIASVLGFLVFAASQPALAQLMELIIETVESGDESKRLLIPLLLSGIALARGIGYFIGNYCIARVSLSIVHELRLQLFDRLTSLPNEYFDRNSSGHLISRITYDVLQVTGAATKAVKVVISEGLTVIALLAFLLWKDWRLTMVFIVIAPLIGVVVMIVGKRLRKLSRKIQVTMGDITQVASEMINGFRVMRSFRGEDYEQQRFKAASRHNFNRNLKLEATSAIATPFLQLIVAIAMGVLLYMAMSFMGTTEPGPFIAYITAAFLLPKPIRQLTSVYSTIQKGLAAAESIFNQLDEEPEVDEGTLEVDRVQGALEIRNLNFRYHSEEELVLRDINLSIKPGETVALVGRSGSGKSTLASLIPRFYHHTEGSILIDGVAVEEYTLASLRNQIALVNQNVVLFNDTVANNIAYGSMAGASMEAITDAARAAHALEFIEQLPEGMQTLVGEDGTRLSGGQRQRLSIARALLKDAPVLILDEATSALDTESERSIQAALDELVEGRTTLVIAHRLSTIEKADKIVVMESGRIVEQGCHAELIANNGAYAQLHSLQFSGS